MRIALPALLAGTLAACGGPVEAPPPEANETAAALATPAADGVTPAATASASPTPSPEPSASASPAPRATPTPGASKSPTPAAAAPATVAAGPPPSFAPCKVCHSVEPGKNGVGPTLDGVLGARAGHVGTFTYSPAMRASGLTWDAATLDRFLTDPRGVVPGTKMVLGGVKDPAKRKEIIAYLKTL